MCGSVQHGSVNNSTVVPDFGTYGGERAMFRPRRSVGERDMMPAPLRFVAAVVCLLVPSAAFADPTAAQALALQQQLRDWIDQTLGSGIKIPEALFQIA